MKQWKLTPGTNTPQKAADRMLGIKGTDDHLIKIIYGQFLRKIFLVSL